jgi:hypothetical protein
MISEQVTGTCPNDSPACAREKAVLRVEIDGLRAVLARFEYIKLKTVVGSKGGTGSRGRFSGSGAGFTGQPEMDGGVPVIYTCPACGVVKPQPHVKTCPIFMVLNTRPVITEVKETE